MIRLLLAIFLLFAVSCARKIPATTSTKKSPSTRTTTKKDNHAVTPSRSQAKKAAPPAKALATYQSAGNDVANVTIRVLANGKFDLRMMIKGKQPGEKDEQISMGGSWKQESNRTVFLFDRKDVDLNALFDKSYASDGEFEILDPHRVAINTQLPVIHVWGVACEKK